MLQRFPAFRRAVFNQYQAILVGGAAAFSLLLANPLPLLALLGLEIMTMPFLIERLRRRIEVERKHAAREAVVIGQDQMYAELPPASKGRFLRLKGLCEQIQRNYASLSPASQGVVAEQVEKFDAILVSCLRRFWLVKKHDETQAGFDDEALAGEIQRLAGQLESADLDPRLREALEQNLEIKRRLEETTQRNLHNRAALVAELDSLESLLQLLLQKSLAATDAESFAAALDDVLRQAEADARSVEEMERLVGALPELDQRSTLSDSLRSLSPASSPPPLPARRVPQGPSRR